MRNTRMKILHAGQRPRHLCRSPETSRYSLNSTDSKELQEAADSLKEQKDLVQAYVVDQVRDKNDRKRGRSRRHLLRRGHLHPERKPEPGICDPEGGLQRLDRRLGHPENARTKKMP